MFEHNSQLFKILNQFYEKGKPIIDKEQTEYKRLAKFVTCVINGTTTHPTTDPNTQNTEY